MLRLPKVKLEVAKSGFYNTGASIYNKQFILKDFKMAEKNPEKPLLHSNDQEVFCAVF